MYLTARKRNEFCVQLFVIQRRTLGGWEDGRELVVSSPPPNPPTSPHLHETYSNKTNYFCSNVVCGSNFVFENISLHKVETSPIDTIRLWANHVSLHIPRKKFPSGSDSNMPIRHIPKITIRSCLVSTYLLFCGSLFLIAEDLRKSSLRDKR